MLDVRPPNIAVVDLTQIAFERDLRWLLGSFLFAVVIAEIALQSAKLAARGRIRRESWPAIVHLILATIVVTTSWLGWTLAISSEQHPAHHLKSVFSLPYCLLLIDVWLLICYFIFVKAVGIPESNKEPLSPSATRASFWLMVIFLTYLGWDGINFWALHGSRAFQIAAWPTMVCFLVALITWFFSRKIRTNTGFILLEVWLVMLLFLFRGLKVAVAANVAGDDLFPSPS